jgi:toxoflavin biosynthesis protein ToxD
MNANPRTVPVAGGRAAIGTDRQHLRRAVVRWGSALVDASYTACELERWLSKECPAFEVEVAAFELGWAPVTNGEFRRFLAAAGGPVPESMSVDEPADNPVWPVPFAQAAAFCRWLASASGLPVRLPTEIEWEWAAGGPDHLEFPWGDEFDPCRANTFESGIGKTTPVGAFPTGAAPCGAVDMAGNVEELTSSLYAPYPGGYMVVDDLLVLYPTGYHVLRGGSCTLGGDAARTTRRHGPVPGQRFRYQGFRILVETA